MAITYAKVTNEVLNLLSAIAGATAAAADTNYLATASTSTVIGPDFLANHILDAIALAQAEIVEAIASTPHHPERNRYADTTSALANLDTIPRTGSSSGKLIVGVPGYVKDGSDNKALDPAPLDAIRSFNRFSSTVYSGFTTYLYAINSGRIEHTRTTAVMEVCVYERPSVLTGNIDIDDWHEAALVQGAVAKLALKENLFAELQAAAKVFWNDHLTQIRNYVNPDLYGRAQAAPSST